MINCIAIYLGLISLVAIVVTLFDKRAAARRDRRIAERTLFLIALLGGAAAMFITMRTIRHKTQHLSFMIGLPVIVVLQIVIAVLIYRQVSW